MERVLICTTQSSPTIPYIEDLLAAPIDLSFTPDPEFTVWWPDHSIFSLMLLKGRERSFHEHVKERECMINQVWVNWFGERTSTNNIRTLYGFVKLWNAVYKQHQISSVIRPLENNSPKLKKEGEGLQVIIDQVLHQIPVMENFSLKVLMSDLLDFISEHFQELYQEYEFDLIYPNNRPDSSVFSEDSRWANRLMVKTYFTQPYTKLMDIFDVIYVDEVLIPPSEHHAVAYNEDIQFCCTVNVYPK